jgi:lipopolysaccharide/colanic/teichoic acid biosynthesis glycosyltransferase
VIGSVLVAPVLVLLALVIRLGDRGPGLIRVRRGGMGGGPFGMWKLRSMRVGATTTAAEGPALVVGVDERLTPVGRLLRGLRTDELPQLLNVAAGQMALVGPRPEALEFIDVTDRRWQAVLSARPGIAGVTQVLVQDWEADMTAAASDPVATYRATILPVKLDIDEWYVRHASPVVDALVVLALVQRFALGRRTTTLHRFARARIPAARTPLGSH